MLSKWKKCDKFAKHKSMYRSNVINVKIAFQESFLLEPMAKRKLRDISIYNQLRLPQNFCPRMKNQCQSRWISHCPNSVRCLNIYAIYAKLVCLNSMFSLIVYACVNQTGIVRTHPQRKLKLSKYIICTTIPIFICNLLQFCSTSICSFWEQDKNPFLEWFFYFCFSAPIHNITS